MTRTRVAAIVAALCLAALVIAWCGRRPASRTTYGRQLRKSDLTAAQIKYGIAPVPDPSIVYQPAVVLVGGGPEAVRSLSATGLTWTIDAGAPHAGELVEGKIMFLTGRAVGRVLDVRKDGGNLAVTLGPVAITEIIRKCDLQYDPIPIDFSEALRYSVPDLPGRVIPAPGSADARPWRGGEPVVATVAFTADNPVPDVSSLVNFTVAPIGSGDGVGLHASSNGGGMKIEAEALIHLDQPQIVPRLRLDDDANLVEATLTLTGAAGLKMMFKAGTDVGLKANVNGRLQASPDLSIPIGGPLPLAVTVRQQILLKTALGVRNATLSATGDYTFGGSFMVGYLGKQWTLGGPIGFTAKQTLMESAAGISIAASGLDLSHQIKMIFGLGAFGFATGPYFSLNTGVGLFKGSDLGTIQCKEATITVGMSGGIGYLIPKPVTDVINFILGTLRIKYRVDGEGGLSVREPLTIINKTQTLPGCGADKG